MRSCGGGDEGEGVEYESNNGWHLVWWKGCLTVGTTVPWLDRIDRYCVPYIEPDLASYHLHWSLSF
jgi:hypothetical protein